MYTYLYIYIHTYTHIYTYTHTHIHPCIHIFIYIHTYTHPCIHIFIYIYTHTYSLLCMCIYIYIIIYIIYIWVILYIYAYIHPCVSLSFLSSNTIYARRLDTAGPHGLSTLNRIVCIYWPRLSCLATTSLLCVRHSAYFWWTPITGQEQFRVWRSSPPYEAHSTEEGEVSSIKDVSR